MLENYIKQQLKDLKMEDSPWTESKVDELAQDYYKTHKLTKDDIKLLQDLKLYSLNDLDEPCFFTTCGESLEDEHDIYLTYSPIAKELRAFACGETTDNEIMLIATEDYDMTEHEDDMKWHMKNWDDCEEEDEDFMEEYDAYLDGWYSILLDMLTEYFENKGIEL